MAFFGHSKFDLLLINVLSYYLFFTGTSFNHVFHMTYLAAHDLSKFRLDDKLK